ncbi:MAG: DUF4124 domain-containing protein, partial [Acidobacteriota bacterium]
MRSGRGVERCRRSHGRKWFPSVPRRRPEVTLPTLRRRVMRMDRFPNRIGALLAAACYALAFSAIAAETTPQIFKCTDASGNVTYQNEACPKNAKAGRID